MPKAGKKRLHPEPSNRPTKKQRDTNPLMDVKNILNDVLKKMPDDNDISAFLRKSVSELKTEKREVVGVFGRTGAGKSSLINAVIGVEKLLPTGVFKACTTVMTKLEANTETDEYVAEVEFITKEEWDNELWSMKHLFVDTADEEDKDDDDEDNIDKLTVLYGDDWENNSLENLMKSKKHRNISSLLQTRTKTVKCASAKNLSEELVQYTKNTVNTESTKPLYWPVVKCVTVKVPNNDLLQHVTLVDLPGNGDCNKERNQMWRKMVGSCSTVWIVTEITRAASEQEAWEILESACDLMGNGGECQNIYFICTKSDISADDHKIAKDEVQKKFNRNAKAKKHFSNDCFKVFTVSSRLFLEKRPQDAEDTEIPQLQRFLQSLNDHHNRALKFVSGAFVILSLMKEARSGNVEQQTAVCESLLTNIDTELKKVRRGVKTVYSQFEEELTEGVEDAKEKCERNLKKQIINKPRGFHQTLRSVVKKNGIHKPKKGKEINLNMLLSSFLTNSIDQHFRQTFPNDRQSGTFYEAVRSFSLDTERFDESERVKLLLKFVKTKEENLKTELCREICDRKKAIYNTLTETVEKEMKECYEKAAQFEGKDSLSHMTNTIMDHVRDKKNTMFDQAKESFLAQLKELLDRTEGTFDNELKKSVQESFKTDLRSMPDITSEYKSVEEHYNKLKQTPQMDSTEAV